MLSAWVVTGSALSDVGAGCGVFEGGQVGKYPDTSANRWVVPYT